MSPQPTPEERLFSLIKKNKNVDASASREQKPSEPRSGFSFKNLFASFFGNLKLPVFKMPKLQLDDKWLDRVPAGFRNFFKASSWKGQWSLLSSGRSHEIDLGWAEHLFFFLLVVFLVIGLPASFIFQPRLENILSRNFKSQDVFQKQIDVLKPLEFYVTGLRSRNFFEPVRPQAPVQKVNVVEALDFLRGAAKDFQLVGIAWGETSQVMIVNKKENATYFLKKGQRIGKTDIVIKDVLKNKAILGFQDAELELG